MNIKGTLKSIIGENFGKYIPESILGKILRLRPNIGI